MDTPVRIERREFKFLIPEAVAARIREDVQPFCNLDPFAVGSPNDNYSIDSLYFDTPDMALFGANEQERLDRYKLRIRTYPDKPGSPCFAEIKGRYHDIILKDRGRMPDHWPELLCGDRIDLPTGRGAYAVERFVALTRVHLARPVILVRYERQPWVSTIDTYARVTFDRHIRSQRPKGLSFETDPHGWRATDWPKYEQSIESMVVLELKFTRDCPWWLIHIVQRYDLIRGAFSKYGLSLRAWDEEVPTRRVPTRALYR